MENFDDVVTDRRLTRDLVDRHITVSAAGPRRRTGRGTAAAAAARGGLDLRDAHRA
jgi:hypothetical protein